jgi:hypothetical protein
VTAIEGISTLDKLEAIVRGNEIYELAKLLPQREDGDVGRPREWPDFMVRHEALLDLVEMKGLHLWTVAAVL